VCFQQNKNRKSVLHIKCGLAVQAPHPPASPSALCSLPDDSRGVAQFTGGGTAAPPQLPGLQMCDISDITFDPATEPKEGGFGNAMRATSLTRALNEFKCNLNE
jgi:hypothetical protein